MHGVCACACVCACYVGTVSFWLTLPSGVDIPSDAMMVWRWGDGNQSEALAVPFSGPGPAMFATSYQYSAAGDYIVELVIYNLASSVTFTIPVSRSVLFSAHSSIFSLIFSA